MTRPSLQGFTKMPNWLFLRLPELSPAGMRVTMVILAESVGWGVEAVILSNADFTRLSGLARSSVQEGIKDALQEQVIERVPYQQSFAYRLKAPEDTTPFPWTSLRQSLAQIAWHSEAYLSAEPDAESSPLDVPTSTSPEFSPYPPDFQPPTRPVFGLEGPEIQASTSPIFRPGQPDFQAPTGPDFGPDPPDFQAGGTENQASTSPISGQGVARNSGYLSAINDGENSDLRVPKEVIQDNTQELCEHTHNGSLFPRARERSLCVCASRYCYDEVLAYAESLKGIRNPGGLAVVYWRSGEMDEEIAKFQQRQAEIAARKAEEEAAQRDELRALALELRARGEPLAEWEREIIAVFADEFAEEHDVPIHRLDVANGRVV
jgi:hypothetical protein